MPLPPDPRTLEPSPILPRTLWQTVLADTLVEVFSVMAGLHVEIGGGPADPSSQVTGIVGIGGAIRARFTLACSDQFIRYLASQMLAIPPDDPGSQKAACDALGETCNIIAGYFKAKVGLGDACMLSVPTIVSGRNYVVRRQNKDERLVVEASYHEHSLQASLEIAN
jgi:CheY-specific phosphatase CheX